LGISVLIAVGASQFLRLTNILNANIGINLFLRVEFMAVGLVSHRLFFKVEL